MIKIMVWRRGVLVAQMAEAASTDCDEVAVIDGARCLRIGWNIIMPLSRPALVTVALFPFLNV